LLFRCYYLDTVKLRVLLIAIAVLCARDAVSQVAPPDLSGVWHLNKEKSRRSGQATTDIWVKIEQRSGSEMTITIRSSELITQKLRIPSDDNRNQIHGVPMKSSAKWNGAVLAVDSVAVFDGTELRMNDVWTLSPGGQLLTFREHHQFGTEAPGDEIWVLDRQPGESWEPFAKPRAGEEEFKDLQVLKGMTAAQLMPVMMGFTKALGVECSHCHTVDDWKRDDKPEFAFARRMMKMVEGVNAGTLHELGGVSCWTCHLGKIKPARMPRASWQDRLDKWPEALKLSEEDSRKPAREVYLNVQSMPNAPAGSFAMTMSVFAGALGVSCDYCHVPGRWDSDEKPTKVKARIMLRLFDEIPSYFEQRRQLSMQCYTCHQGSAKPQQAPA
jgi:hypothetical protein